MNRIDQTILEWTSVAARTGLTWHRLLQMEAAGTFPARIPDEASGQCWRREDVENWIRERAAS